MSDIDLTDDDYWRGVASECYSMEDISIDEDAVVSLSEGGDAGEITGAWVQAWVYVPLPDDEVEMKP